MAELKSIKFPGLDEPYTVASTDKELENAKATGGIGWEDTEVHKIDEKYLPEQAMTDDELLECLVAADILSAVTDADGAILTDENSKILIM